MKKLSILISMLLVSTLTFAQIAVSYPNARAQMEVVMLSVNQSNICTTGSRYSSQVYEVGATSPVASSPIRKAPPSEGIGEETDYDPSNAQYGPVPDGTLFMLLLAAVATAGIAVRRRRMTETTQMVG